MKRFYREARAAPVAGGWQVELDGRGVKTAAGRPQVVASASLAAALAAEWTMQGEEIDPHGFTLRDLADYAIDIAGPSQAATLAELAGYAETDTLCYRAEPGEPLHLRQVDVWEPLLTAAEARYDVHFTRVAGIMPRPQPPQTLARLSAALAALDPFALAGVHAMTALAASLVIALAALGPDADGDALWRAANLEEDWQAELWGRDAEAAARRERRRAAFLAALRFTRLANG